ncbi:hypothetical protein RSP795_17165 [Ralstonia solanacearum]|nr:hypothetical protein RSP795_17165 [Ralstonia solanacearum]
MPTNVVILLVNSLTLLNDPRRMARVVMIEKKRSTWLSQLEYVGTKCICQRGRCASHARTFGCLWLA